MQPAEAVIRLPQEERIRVAQEELSSSRAVIRDFQYPQYRKAFTEYLKKNSPNMQFVFYYSDFPLSLCLKFDGRFIYELPPKGSFSIFSPKDEILTAWSVTNKLHLDPNKRGILVEISSGYIWKFRPAQPRVSCDDQFWKRFDRSKVNTAFEEWLWGEIYDLYIKCENPRIDPLHGKREELWQSALPLFRVYKQRVTYVEDLPYGIDPASLAMISLDTVDRSIQKIRC